MQIVLDINTVLITYLYTFTKKYQRAPLQRLMLLLQFVS
jgi:hypothetical protein